MNTIFLLAARLRQLDETKLRSLDSTVEEVDLHADGTVPKWRQLCAC